jgi:hypothetical protein
MMIRISIYTRAMITEIRVKSGAPMMSARSPFAVLALKPAMMMNKATRTIPIKLRM